MCFLLFRYYGIAVLPYIVITLLRYYGIAVLRYFEIAIIF